MDLSFEEQIRLAIINGVFAFTGVLVGAFFPFLKEVIQSLSAKKLELIKIHDSDRLSAYKNLLKYSKQLNKLLLPDNEAVYSDFIENCRREFHSLIEYYPYFSKNVMDILDSIEVLYNISTMDLNWNTPPHETVENELPEISKKLYRQIIQDFKKWTYK